MSPSRNNWAWAYSSRGRLRGANAVPGGLGGSGRNHLGMQSAMARKTRLNSKESWPSFRRSKMAAQTESKI